jgi:dolichol kinase
MLAAIACLIGLTGLLIIAELLGKNRVLRGEYHRKFLHISAGCFIAFWPWLISWQAIKIIGLAMAVGMIAERYISFLNYRGRIGRATYGEIFFAISIFLLPFLTDNEVFFAIAILEVALADGLAAIIGVRFIKNWGYSVLGYKKTVIGSMIFWMASVFIIGVGLLWASDVVQFNDYVLLVLLAPPALTVAENLGVLGLDNLAVPILTVLLLNIAQR